MRHIVLTVLAAAAVGACGSGAGATPQPTPEATAGQTPSASAAATPPALPTGGAKVVVTFAVSDGERFKVELVKPADIARARAMLDGSASAAIPNGVIVRGSADVNTGYSWHIDPATFEFADVTMELCDGLPKDIENGSFTAERFCPWTAKVVEITG